eukprot:2312119-Amphidinium_carterae.1
MCNWPPPSQPDEWPQLVLPEYHHPAGKILAARTKPTAAGLAGRFPPRPSPPRGPRCFASVSAPGVGPISFHW